MLHKERMKLAQSFLECVDFGKHLGRAHHLEISWENDERNLQVHSARASRTPTNAVLTVDEPNGAMIDHVIADIAVFSRSNSLKPMHIDVHFSSVELHEFLLRHEKDGGIGDDVLIIAREILDGQCAVDVELALPLILCFFRIVYPFSSFQTIQDVRKLWNHARSIHFLHRCNGHIKLHTFLLNGQYIPLHLGGNSRVFVDVGQAFCGHNQGTGCSVNVKFVRLGGGLNPPSAPLWSIVELTFHIDVNQLLPHILYLRRHEAVDISISDLAQFLADDGQRMLKVPFLCSAIGTLHFAICRQAGNGLLNKFEPIRGVTLCN